MSVWKDLLHRRFWLSVLLNILIAVSVCAIGAWFIVSGLLRPEQGRGAVYTAVLLGAFAGGKCAASGRQQGLLRSVLNAATALSALWLIGLTSPAPWCGTHTALCALAAAAVGAVSAILLRTDGRSRKRKHGVAKKR